MKKRINHMTLRALRFRSATPPQRTRRRPCGDYKIKINKNGIPAAREVRAMNDLRIAISTAGTPYQVRFIAYNAEVRP